MSGRDTYNLNRNSNATRTPSWCEACCEIRVFGKSTIPHQCNKFEPVVANGVGRQALLHTVAEGSKSYVSIEVAGVKLYVARACTQCEEFPQDPGTAPLCEHCYEEADPAAVTVNISMNIAVVGLYRDFEALCNRRGLIARGNDTAEDPHRRYVRYHWVGDEHDTLGIRWHQVILVSSILEYDLLYQKIADLAMQP